MPGRRAGGIGLALLLTIGSVTGCSVSAGSAVLIDGNGVSEQSVQHDTSALIAQNPTATAPTDVEIASYNRAQITYLVRHALIAKALAAKDIVITDQELNQTMAEVAAQPAESSNLALQLGLPASEEAGVTHDVLALEALTKALPAAGVTVENVTVTAEGVPATTRDQAVALRSQYLSDPATMDAAVTAAGDSGLPKNPYNLIQTPLAGTAGLYQAASPAVVVLANATGYIVLRTTGRTVTPTRLTQATFGAAIAAQTSTSGSTNLPALFDLGALLVAPYQAGTEISVNPRYGVWDPASLQVVPGNDGL